MLDIKEKVAVVTGGARGIGLAYVKEFLKNGLKGVTIIDINKAEGNAVVEELKKEFGKDKVIFVPTDITDDVQLKNAFDKTVNTFKQFDILVNNAGVLNEFKWRQCVNTNFVAVINASMLAIEDYFPKYKIGEEAVILNTASFCGFFAIDGLPTYTATKYGIVGFSKAMGPLFQSTTNVKVVCICPHATNTSMKTLTPNEIPNNILSKYKGHWDQLFYQPPEVVAKAGIKLMKEEPSGTVWFVSDGKISKVQDTVVEAL